MRECGNVDVRAWMRACGHGQTSGERSAAPVSRRPRGSAAHTRPAARRARVRARALDRARARSLAHLRLGLVVQPLRDALERRDAVRERRRHGVVLALRLADLHVAAAAAERAAAAPGARHGARPPATDRARAIRRRARATTSALGLPSHPPLSGVKYARTCKYAKYAAGLDRRDIKRKRCVLRN